jgi:hypothetical protein
MIETNLKALLNHFHSILLERRRVAGPLCIKKMLNHYRIVFSEANKLFSVTFQELTECERHILISTKHFCEFSRAYRM